MSDPRQIEVNSFREGLLNRSENKCELCSATDDLSVYEVPPVVNPDIEKSALLCSKCIAELADTNSLDVNHWLCLNESAWTQVPAVQVLVWRLLNKLTNESWAQDLLDQVFLEDDVKAWAEDFDDNSGLKVVDSNGTKLIEGDTVTIIKDLNVKGTSFVAKRGTIVRSIHLGSDPELVEGKVNGVVIFLKTCFLKRS